MENINVISTPDITGNIGSCNTNRETVTIGRDGFWTVEKRDIATNSCTGEVYNSDYWEFSGAGISMFLILPVFLFCLIVVIVEIVNNHF